MGAPKMTMVQNNAKKFADDVHELSRMPITALRITSEAEEKNLRRKTIGFMFLDTLIIINTVLFLAIGPIESDKPINNSSGNCPLVSQTNEDVICKSRRYMLWCCIALPFSILSLTLDYFTLR